MIKRAAVSNNSLSRDHGRSQEETAETTTTAKRGALFHRKKPRMVDKIAEGMSMFLSGPAPLFAGVGVKLASQAAKGIKDNVQHYRRQTGRGILGILGSAGKIGYKLGKDKRYKRMGVKGVTGSYNRRPAPWEV